MSSYEGVGRGLVIPLEDPHPSLLGSPMNRNNINSSRSGAAATPGRSSPSPRAYTSTTSLTPAAGGSRAGNVLATSGGSITAASADLQRSLLQQQLHQAQREVHALKDELFDAGAQLSETTTQLNEQRIEYSSLTHRYGATVEKLTAAEADVKRMEAQLVQERSRVAQMREEREYARQQHREASWEVERLAKALENAEARRGLDQREVQRMLEDRAQYVPTVEVKRLESELKDAQQSVLNRLTSALDTLLLGSEESETAMFVARSAVLSAATDLESRLARAESALDSLHKHICQYREGLDHETNTFLLALMTENKELWQHLTKLQSEYDLLNSEAQLLSRRGPMVPQDQHAYVQRQLEHATEKLTKAQKVVQSQTALATAHELEMQRVLQENEELHAKLSLLTERHTETQAASEGKSRALAEADEALRDATTQITKLQDALTSERAAAQESVRKLDETNTAVQQEYETQLRRLQQEASNANSEAQELRRVLEDAEGRAAAAEAETDARGVALEEYRRRHDALRAEQEASQLEQIGHVRGVLEDEMALLRERLQQAQQEARLAARQREECKAEHHATEAARRALEKDLELVKTECEQQRKRADAAQEGARRAAGELEQAYAQRSEEGSSIAEMRRQLEAMRQQCEAVERQLREEKTQHEERCAGLQREWRTSEVARASLQEELKAIRARCAEDDSQRQAEERAGADREHLMRENLRLHEQYQAVQQESRRLGEELKAARVAQHAGSALTQQLDDLQHRLKELPQLRQAADDARREMLKAREETQLLRKERDDMAAKLDYFLEESRAAARMDDEFDRALRDASEAAKRLGGQVSNAKSRGASAASLTGAGAGGGYHVFENTRPTARIPSPRRPSQSAGGGVDGGLVRSPGASASAPNGGLSAVSARQLQQQQQKDVYAGPSAALNTTPQRPWKS